MVCYQLYDPIHASQGQNVRMTAAGDALSGRQSDGNGYIGGSLLIYVGRGGGEKSPGLGD
ncbi:mismatch repair protein 5 [Pyricularia oryzae]|nr:mismatch repair protein 5 [Pyricularia oryzae]KAI7931228.1 mismatch repair protein 5 [Pyricularia oryzae]